MVKTGFPNIDRPRFTDGNPWASQTPLDLLKREYRITTTQTVPVPVTSPSVLSFDYLPFLLNPSYGIFPAISTFRYLRFKAIKFRIAWVSSPFIYGAIAINSCPFDGVRRSTPNADYGSMSFHDTMWLDVSTMNEAELVIPWAFPNSWLDMPTHTDWVGYWAMVMLLRVYFITGFVQPLTTTGPTSFHYEVYACLIDPEVSGPIHAGTYSASEAPVATYLFPRHEAQSGLIDAAFAAGTTYATKKATDYVTKKAEGLAESGVNSATGYLETGIEYVMDFFDGDDTPVDDPVPGVVDVEGVATTSVVPNVFGGMVHTPPANVLGDGSIRVINRYPTHSLKQFLSLPSLFSVGTTAALGSYFSWRLDPFAVIHSTANPFAVSQSCSRIRFLGQFFRQWRGGLRYTLCFNCTPLATWRLSLTLDYSNGAVSPGFGDVYSKLITVKGSTTVSISVPYLSPVQWQPTRGGDTEGSYVDNPFPFMNLNTLSCVSADTTNPPLIVYVYESAASDFRLNSRCEPAPNFLSARHQAQMKITSFRTVQEDAGAHDAGSRHPHEAPVTFEAMCKRWSGRDDTAILNYPTYYSDPTSNSVSALDAISSLFFFWRGQFKFKIAYSAMGSIPPNTVQFVRMDNDKASLSDGLPSINRACDGYSAINLGLTRVQEFTTPFVCNVEWMPVLPGFSVGGTLDIYNFVIDSVNMEDESEITPVVGAMFVAGGPDFTFNMELPPPYNGARWYDQTTPQPENLDKGPRKHMFPPPLEKKVPEGKKNKIAKVLSVVHSVSKPRAESTDARTTARRG